MLLETHRAAAQVLVAAHKHAWRRSAVEKDAAVDILMCGHGRRAAAILLEAWMRVTEGRPPRTARGPARSAPGSGDSGVPDSTARTRLHSWGDFSPCRAAAAARPRDGGEMENAQANRYTMTRQGVPGAFAARAIRPREHGFRPLSCAAAWTKGRQRWMVFVDPRECSRSWRCSSWRCGDGDHSERVIGLERERRRSYGDTDGSSPRVSADGLGRRFRVLRGAPGWGRLFNGPDVFIRDRTPEDDHPGPARGVGGARPLGQNPHSRQSAPTVPTSCSCRSSAHHGRTRRRGTYRWSRLTGAIRRVDVAQGQVRGMEHRAGGRVVVSVDQ